MVNRIAVIGDVMLDAYDYGRTRDNPEEDTLCTTTRKITYRLGGAGNVAINLAKLGVEVFFVSRVGKDSSGDIIKMLLRANNINHQLIIDENITTTLKQRTLSDKDEHYHCRNDREGARRTRIQNSDGSITDHYGPAIELDPSKIQIGKYLRDYPLIVVSDYAKGIMTSELVRRLKQTRSKLLVDTKPANAHFYEGVWLLKPNSKEARQMTGLEDDLQAAKKLRDELECRVLLTRGENGMSYFGVRPEKVEFSVNPHVKPREVKDRVGAGDNVIATLAYALNEDYTMRRTMLLASKAAGIAVCHRGCYAPTLKELGVK